MENGWRPAECQLNGDNQITPTDAAIALAFAAGGCGGQVTPNPDRW